MGLSSQSTGSARAEAEAKCHTSTRKTLLVRLLGTAREMLPEALMQSGRLEIHVPTVTIIRLLLAALLVSCALRVWPETVFVFVSLIFATALHPTVSWLERKRLPRSVAVLIVGAAVLAVVAAFIAFVVPPLVVQIGDLVVNLPVLHARAISRLPPGSHLERAVIDMLFKVTSSPEVVETVGQPMMWGRATASGVAGVLLVSVTTLYLLSDGRRVFAWLLAYAPRQHRVRVAVTLEGMSKLVHGYVRGQLIVSGLFGAFSGCVLAVLHVPNPLALAILAALCDIIPLAGIILALVPAALLAFAVSPMAALTVVISFLLYHWTEAYFICPRVFGVTLRLPTLAVVLGLVVGYALMGILGAIFVLPLIAAYPIVEKEWLRDYLAPDVLAAHRALARADSAGGEVAVNAVLRGERPSSVMDPPPPSGPQA
jgi:predicted PurR-regulated permease PerM